VTNLKALAKIADARFQKYLTWLERQPLSDHTRRAYHSRVNAFLGYLTLEGENLENLLAKDSEREYVLRSYKRFLKEDMLPASVNASLTAIDHFLAYCGARKTKVPREDLPQEAPRALSKTERRLFLRKVAGTRRCKDRAVALLIFYTGIRVSECANLNVDDVSVIGRKNRIVIRSGKGDRYQEIPLNSEARDAIKDWLDERMKKFEENEKFQEAEIEPVLFLNPQGKRLSTAGIDLIVRKVGQSCG
jgi:site-specific recombinase XerD